MATQNSQLRKVMTEAGCSYEGLARRVNTIGISYGLSLTYDKSSVSYWVKGKTPRGMVPLIVAEALSQKLDRVVTPAEIGFGDEWELDLVSSSLKQQSDLAATLDITEKLGKADMERREFLYLLPFSASAALGPQRDWLLHLLRGEDGVGNTVRMEQVENMRLMMKVFIEADNTYGGSHARTALASYLHHDVVPLIRTQSTDTVRRELFIASAELCMTLGWMTYDIGAWGLAQRYLTQGLSLAAEAGSPGFAIGSNLLSALSHVATFTGNAAEAVNIAQVAVHSAVRSGSPASLTRALAMEARAYATLGDRKTAAVMARTEAARAAQGDDPEWMGFLDEHYMTNQFAYCCRETGQTQRMFDFAESSLAHSTGRQIVSNTTYMAWARLDDGHLEEACRLGIRAADQATRMQSRQVGRLVLDLADRMVAKGHEREPLAAEFLRHTTALQHRES
ncbi:hypothetical protein [Streptomyces sp. NPDC058145]|uniref:hypothetical protein n=1 Tax=Streptomyces sp. NPDC058145 TaxID=3346356 RepID=UPI0036E2D1BC